MRARIVPVVLAALLAMALGVVVAPKAHAAPQCSIIVQSSVSSLAVSSGNHLQGKTYIEEQKNPDGTSCQTYRDVLQIRCNSGCPTTLGANQEDIVGVPSAFRNDTTAHSITTSYQWWWTSWQSAGCGQGMHSHAIAHWSTPTNSDVLVVAGADRQGSC